MKTMKQFSLTLLLIAATICVNATVRTVSNSPAGGAQYSNLSDAYNASANDDTLLLEGTNLDYALYVQWAKRLTVIGIGYNPNKQLPLLTRIFQVGSGGAVRFISGGNGSKFYGIHFTQLATWESTSSNFLFENCKFDNGLNFDNQTMSNIIFKNCIIGGHVRASYTLPNTNINFFNCVLNGYLYNGAGPTILCSYTFDHCLFLLSSAAIIRDVQNNLIKNCIFMNSATLEYSTGNNTYINCINRLGSFPSYPGNSGNLSTTNPNFVSYTLGATYSPSHNYNLQSGSPAILAGSDGTDIGVNGGFSNFNEAGEVLINPIVREMNIMNTTVQPNGTMNVQLHATKPNDQ